MEISLREIGYGDTAINKRMKSYVNFFYSILNKIDDWENLDREGQKQIFKFYLNIKNESFVLTEYFEKYRNYLKKSTFNSLLKGVIKPNF